MNSHSEANRNGNVRRSAVDVQVWTVRRLVDAIEGAGNERIFIPSFQRDFVWNAERQRDLVESIRTMKPIGALLFYDDGICSGKQQYQIVDGLQRSTTLRNYETQVFTTYTADEADDLFIGELLDVLDVAATSATERRLAEKRMRSSVTQWIRGRRSFSSQDGFKTASLLKGLAEAVNTSEALGNVAALDLTEQYLERLRKELEIGEYPIPVVVFKGEKRLLPDIFEKLNTRGIKLNKFDILASSWSDRAVEIATPAIVEAAALRRRELAKASVQRITAERVTGAYELYDAVCSFGIVLVERYPRLFPKKKSWTASDPLSCGFNVVAHSFGLSLSDIERVPGYLDDQESPDVYLQQLFEACGEVSMGLEPTLGCTFDGSKAPATHTELQMASIIAAIYRMRVGRSSKSFLSPAERMRSVRQHYLWDTLRREWSGTGDTKAVRAVTSDRYGSDVGKSLFFDTARAWYSEHLNDASGRGTKWLDAAGVALLRAYLFASDVDTRNAQTLYLSPAHASASIVFGTPNVISNVQIKNAAGVVVADPGSALPRLATSPSAEQLRAHLQQRINVMLDKIALTYEFSNSA